LLARDLAISSSRQPTAEAEAEAGTDPPRAAEQRTPPAAHVSAGPEVRWRPGPGPGPGRQRRWGLSENISSRLVAELARREWEWGVGQGWFVLQGFVVGAHWVMGDWAGRWMDEWIGGDPDPSCRAGSAGVEGDHG